jgi:hypothetical protein
LFAWSFLRDKCFELIFLGLLVWSVVSWLVLRELWKWHSKLGHLSFDLLYCLSKLNLVRGLPRLRFEKELVCALCRHAKMVASSHPPLTDVMTVTPGFKGKSECIEHMCARIKFHTCVVSVYTKTQYKT